jgi:hypothetical protein
MKSRLSLRSLLNLATLLLYCPLSKKSYCTADLLSQWCLIQHPIWLFSDLSVNAFDSLLEYSLLWSVAMYLLFMSWFLSSSPCALLTNHFTTLLSTQSPHQLFSDATHNVWQSNKLSTKNPSLLSFTKYLMQKTHYVNKHVKVGPKVVKIWNLLYTLEGVCWNPGKECITFEGLEDFCQVNTGAVRWSHCFL